MIWNAPWVTCPSFQGLVKVIQPQLYVTLLIISVNSTDVSDTSSSARPADFLTSHQILAHPMSISGLSLSPPEVLPAQD
ncbi:hypothetical protein EMIT0196P_60169 [Pseudomonas chlororaphis]